MEEFPVVLFPFRTVCCCSHRALKWVFEPVATREVEALGCQERREFDKIRVSPEDCLIGWHLVGRRHMGVASSSFCYQFLAAVTDADRHACRVVSDMLRLHGR